MPVEQDFLPYAVGSTANVLSQAEYAALTSLLQNGLQSGVVPSKQLNKILRQASIMAAVLAQFICDRSGQNAIDDGTITTLLQNLKLSAAAINGDSSKVFSVSNATDPTHAIPKGQADTLYAASNSTLKPGDVVDVSSNNLPANRIWMPTAPTNLPRASYPALFAQIGTTWGIGDGSTTFGIPYCPPDYAIVHANGNISTSTVGQVIQHVHGPASGNGFWVDQAGLYTVQAGGGTANLNSATSTTSTGGAANLAAGIRFRKTIVYQ